MAIISASEFGVKMEKLKKAARDGLIDPSYGTLPTQGRLLLQRIVKLTPAFSEDQQRHALRSDMLEIFEIHRPETIAAAVKEKGRGQIRGWVHDTKADVHLYVEAAGIVLTEGEAQAIHRKNYTARGRTRRLGKGFKYMIAPRVFSSYLTKLYAAVGKGRAGWLAGAMALGVKVPSYVTRHGPAQGDYVNGLAAERPYIEVRNHSKWSSREEGERIVNSAIASRMRDMERYLSKQVELAAKRAGLDITAA